MENVNPFEENERYRYYKYSWRLMRDVMMGEDAIKRGNELYLPMPSAFVDIKVPPSEQGTGQNTAWQREQESYISTTDIPSWHENVAYWAYKSRAHFPSIALAALNGFLGVAQRKPVISELPGNMEYLLRNATTDGFTLPRLYSRALSETLVIGRHVLVVDIVENGTPVIVQYRAEEMIDWEEQVKNGRREIIYARFRQYVVRNESRVEKSIILFLDEEGLYCVREHISGQEEVLHKPMYHGKRLDYIPIVVIGALCNDASVDQSPMRGIADCAIQIYLKDADLSHSEYLSACPTLFMSGVDASDAPQKVGSGVAVALSNPDAKAWYTETDTDAMNHILNHISRLYDEAVNYGVSALGGAKKSAESAEALRIRQSSSSATLQSVVHNVESGILTCLRYIENWMSSAEVVDSKVVFTANQEFSENSLSAQERQALVAEWMAGAISHNTYLFQIKRAGLLPEDVTVEDEKSMIANDNSLVQTV